MCCAMFPMARFPTHCSGLLFRLMPMLILISGELTRYVSLLSFSGALGSRMPWSWWSPIVSIDVQYSRVTLGIFCLIMLLLLFPYVSSLVVGFILLREGHSCSYSRYIMFSTHQSKATMQCITVPLLYSLFGT